MQINWIAVKEDLPNVSNGAFFISGHEWFGIGIWENGKGWIKGFIGEWPYGDEGDFITDYFLNDEVMHWSHLSGDYPVYGTRMGEIENLNLRSENVTNQSYRKNFSRGNY